MGKVYLVGAGPGDPELATVRAVRRLREADVVLYDALVHPSLLEHCRADAERVFVGKRAGRISERQSAINARLVELAREGKTVVRLKGGDPFLFGRGSEEAELLAAEGIPFEVVPGVPASVAVPVHAGISLTHRDLASSVAYVTATESPEKDRTSHDWAKLATATQTLVVFMGLRRLDELMQLLVAHGRDPRTPAAVVQSGSLPSQRTVTGTVATIAQLAKDAHLGMPALTIVGDVVMLRDRLRWFDSKPLFGKRVLVTRPEGGQSSELATLLREEGADAVLAPTIRIAPSDEPEKLLDAARNAGRYDWIAFTSRNAVERFFAALDEVSLDVRALGHAKVCAVGPATCEALRMRGIRADAVPIEHRGEEVARTILENSGSLSKLRVLLPRAKIAREALPTLLREAGAEVDIVTAYVTETSPADAAEVRARLAAVDAVTFTSSSTVESLLALVPDAAALLQPLKVASIGPLTTDTAKRLGVRIDVTASEHTSAGLVRALKEHTW